MAKLFPENTFVAPQLPNPARDLVRLVVAEAPGEQESLEGQPLVGGSGRVFNSLLRSAGIPRDGLTIINCINCRPPDNLFPSDREARSYISKDDAEQAVKQCLRNHVTPMLQSRDWKRIDLVGQKSLTLVGGARRSISALRGSPISIPVGDKTLKGMPILHPSYLMRDQSMLLVAANDLQKSLVEPPEHYNPYPSIEDVRNFKFKTFSFDIECPKYKTIGPSAPAEMVGLCGKTGEAMCVPIKGEYRTELRRIFSEAEVIIGHNALQFDIPKLFEALEIKDETV